MAMAPFVKKLDDIMRSEQSSIIWSPSGKVIVLTDPEDFAKNVLPRWFKHNNLRSFNRQCVLPHATRSAVAHTSSSPLCRLNMHGFQRNRDQGGEKDGQISFMHEHFVEGERSWPTE